MLTVEDHKYLEEKISGLAGKIDDVKASVNDKFNELKEFFQNHTATLKENTQLQIDYLREQNETFKKYHDQHFTQIENNRIEITKVPELITAARESIRKDLTSKSRFNSGTIISIVSVIIAGVAVMVTIL